MAHRHSIQNRVAVEKPKRARAVNTTETTVTYFAPNRRVSRSERRLEVTVPREMTMDTTPP